MGRDGALQYIDKTLSNLAENADDILWVNPEVVELVMDIRNGLTARGVENEQSDAQVEAALTVYDPLFPPVGNAWKPEQVERMRAALRAAYEAGGA